MEGGMPVVVICVYLGVCQMECNGEGVRSQNQNQPPTISTGGPDSYRRHVDRLGQRLTQCGTKTPSGPESEALKLLEGIVQKKAN